MRFRIGQIVEVLKESKCMTCSGNYGGYIGKIVGLDEKYRNPMNWSADIQLSNGEIVGICSVSLRGNKCRKSKEVC